VGPGSKLPALKKVSDRYALCTQQRTTCQFS
jgi:hypothetical protein